MKNLEQSRGTRFSTRSYTSKTRRYIRVAPVLINDVYVLY